MSTLRRFAQTNSAALATETPRKSVGAGPTTPQRANGHSSAQPSPVPVPRAGGAHGGAEPRLPLLPVTPRRTQIAYMADSPASTPSISSSTPFDWDAARGHRPPPYGNTPLQRLKKARQSDVGALGTPAKAAKQRVVRKKGLMERLSAIPQNVAHEISMFPQNVPLPPPTTSAWLIGGFMHFLHLVVRISRGWHAPECGYEYGDSYAEEEPWFDWMTIASLMLVGGALANAVRMLMHIRIYHLHQQPEPVASPRASFVPADLDFAPLQPPALLARLRAGAWHALGAFSRFLLKRAPSHGSAPGSSSGSARRVQQLEVWAPGETELALFYVYSPAHALLWMATTSSNWMLMCLVMVGVGVQLQLLTRSFEALVKDRAIIAGEVMHEYNEKFVNPRVNPIRKDVSVMTNQSEIVNVWED